MEVASAVRVPTPEPEDTRPSPGIKRKRSPSSRSPSPRRPPSPPGRRSPPTGPSRDSRRDKPSFNGPLPKDIDRERAVERQRQFEHRRKEQPREIIEPTAEEKQAAAKKEYEDLLGKRSGGVYIPPARLRALQAQITDQNSKEFQRMAWEALKKSINGLINKVNISNIKHIVPELFGENLVRGRGLFCRSIMKAQAASLPFSPIFAATAAIVNTKLPQVGELLVRRLVVSFRKAFKRNDKAVCISSTSFLAHLVNQQVCTEMLAAQLLLLLLHKPTDDSVEIAVSLVKECGQHLEEMSAPIALAVFDQFRNILHEATDLEKRTQYMIEVLFQIRKDRWKEYPAVKEELDLVEEEDQITHQISLDGEMETQDTLNIFKFDPEYEEHEEAYKQLKAEILGEADGSADEEYDSDASSEEEEENVQEKEVEIKDQTNTDLVNLRRSIYLTIKSSGTFEEACHKLMRINLPPGQEDELPSMIIECASQERTFDKFYGNIGERFCKLNRLWSELFQEQFVKYYETIHRFEANRLRIIAQYFGHLLAGEGIGWHVLSIVHLNEDETTSSSRIFIKILFEELVQAMGLPKLTAKLRDEMLQPSLAGIFPTDDPKNTRFSINFFTAIGMGMLTEDMREHLKNIPQPAAPALPEHSDSDSDSVSSYSSYSSRSRTVSESRSPSPRPRATRAASRSPSRSPSRSRRRRDDSYSSRSRSRSRSVTLQRRSRTVRDRSASPSRSPSPPPRRAARRRSPSEDSRSPSPPPRRRRRESSELDDAPPARRRRNSSSDASAAAPRRRRNSSSEESRSPSPPPRRRR
ncbi:MIF4G-domain-containing protein [Microthyrium microscopicum]|uniref:Pre-mRNA-splicing factor CWC22 n=1 Tax=Microthyrium microscopicum TaxID=703497 RepID=A0A6A6TVV8_9PEZI|nr:MIF4G-domain-containing protein [Microthyrium microscopicum]